MAVILEALDNPGCQASMVKGEVVASLAARRMGTRRTLIGIQEDYAMGVEMQIALIELWQAGVAVGQAWVAVDDAMRDQSVSNWARYNNTRVRGNRLNAAREEWGVKHAEYLRVAAAGDSFPTG
ncbi:MAG: hypothetical protein ABIQ99_06645 [Thermoflexales bacterium]